MHHRYVTTRRGDKVYRYSQLVESYRREDGTPATRVVKHLGKLPEPVVEALCVALRAGREGESLVLASEAADGLQVPTLANLRYLDLVVLLELWNQWGLSDMLAELMGPSERTLALEEVVKSLVLQRCCEPDTKLAATRWVPQTALPELLGFEPSEFNNTRVHRALDALYEVIEALQERLAETYLADSDGFRALFMDVTDTYFEGRGSPLAEATRTKAGLYKTCLGIVLLVNEDGLPLRWEVVRGKARDWTVMAELASEIKAAPWMNETLIVFDRAMGNRSTVAELKDSGLHFLTAAHRDSLPHYTTALPYKAFEQLEIVGTDESYEDDIARVADAARHAGLVEIHDSLFVMDLGVRVPVGHGDGPSESPRRRPAGRPRRGLVHQIRRARKLAEEKATEKLTLEELGQRHGRSAVRMGQLIGLLKLAPDVLARVEEMGPSLPLSERDIRMLGRLPLNKQLAALEAAIGEANAEAQDEAQTAPGSTRDPYHALGPVRMVAYFNPQLFVDMRRRTEDHCRQLQDRVEALNAELANCKRSRSRDTTYRKFSRELERLRYLDVFDVELEPLEVISPTGTVLESFRGDLVRRPEAWVRRRRYDGFVLLLGHPNLSHTAADLVEAYQSKDVVEKGFQTIKSVVELRPILHQQHPKVLAHVALCMLALLLMRTLRRRLRDAGSTIAASMCLDHLKTCHLNLRQPTDAEAAYDITRPNDAQRALLDMLSLNHLVSEEHLRPRLAPRQI